METGLVVSAGEKGTEYIKQQLTEFSVERIVTAGSGAEARRMVLEQDFDIVVINAPLRDEPGEQLSQHIVSLNKSQVLLIVKSELYDDISNSVEDYGVITVAKPINRNMFWFSLKLAKAAQGRLTRMQNENAKLVQKIDDIRVVDRAKHVLISYLKMNEAEAHKYIEKQAMDTRSTRRKVAEGILKLYEDR